MNDSTFQSFFLPILREDFSLLNNYSSEPETPCSFPFLLFRGEEDEHVSLDEMQAWAKKSKLVNPVYEMPGDHFFIRKPDKMLEIISTHICQTLAVNIGS